MKPRPKPLLGLLLGLLLGVVIVGLLWQLGVAPPDRFILFGVLAVTIGIVELLVTQTTSRGKRRFVTVMVVAGVFAGVALTGIPETFMGTGSVSDGCTLTVSGDGQDGVTPEDTSAFDPFDTTPTGTITWESSTDEVLTNWDSGLGMSIGGIPITLFTATRDNAAQATSWGSTENVADYLKKLEDETGLQLRGTYHAFGYIHADEGDCDMSGYIRVTAESAFATPLIIALWVAGALLAIIVIWVAASVRRSIRDARAFAEKGEAPATEAPATRAEPVGAFTAEPIAETQTMPTADTEVMPTTNPATDPPSEPEDPAAPSGGEKTP